jgi:hypothetical protein
MRDLPPVSQYFVVQPPEKSEASRAYLDVHL